MWHGELRWEVVEISLGRCASEIDGGREEISGSRACFKTYELVICFSPACEAFSCTRLPKSSWSAHQFILMVALPFKKALAKCLCKRGEAKEGKARDSEELQANTTVNSSAVA